MPDKIVFPTLDWKPLLPFLSLFVTAMILLIVGIRQSFNRKFWLVPITLVGITVTWWATISQWETSVSMFQGMLVFDPFSRFFFLVFLAAAGLVSLLSLRYIPSRTPDVGEYFSLLLASVLGMMCMVATRDLVVFFIGLELMSIAIYVLVGFTRHEMRPAEGAMKYFLLGAFASGFILYGIAFIYGATGTTNLEGIVKAFGAHPKTFGFLPLGLALLFFGFCFKVAMVPFHTWVPDAYEGAPTPVTALMSVGVKAAAFAAFLRIFVEGFMPKASLWGSLLGGLAVLTMTIGNITAISQNNVKRMLAYSSIAHAGYLLIAFASLQTKKAGIVSAVNESIMFYLVAYLFMNIGAFAVLIAMGKDKKEAEHLKDFQGLSEQSPFLALAMAIFLFSLAGIPPTVGFVGKIYLFGAAIRADLYPLAILGVVNSVISVYYYLKIVVAMYMKSPEKDTPPLPALSGSLLVVLLVCLYATLHFGVFSSSLMQTAKISSKLLGM